MHVPHLIFDRERREFREDCAVVYEARSDGSEECRMVFMNPEETTHWKLERRVEELERELKLLKEAK